MTRPRKSTRGRRKKVVAKTVSKVRNDAPQTPLHGYGTRSKRESPGKDSPVSIHSETSPFRGFPETVATKGKVKELKLYESFHDDEEVSSPVAIVAEDNRDPFDKLLDDNHKSHLTKNINLKTYSNRNKKVSVEKGLLEFQDHQNRHEVIQWLNDTRNVFEHLTQSQYDPVLDACSQVTLDVPSVSQQNNAKVNQTSRSSKRVRQSRYTLRARSLDIQVKKNVQGGRSKGHSFSGDTPDVESYNIEEVVTPIPAQEDAKIIIDIMEGEYLDNIEKELQQDKKNQSGWDRIKDMRSSISPKKPKQLDIVKRGSPPDGSKKLDSIDKSCRNLTYDHDLLENYFIENMEKLLNGNDKSSTSKSMISSVLDSGKKFLASLKKLVGSDQDIVNDIKPIISELQNFFKSCKNESTQTFVHAGLDKSVQTKSSGLHVGTQTQSNCVHIGIQIESNLVHNGVQTDEKKYSHEFVQTDYKSDVHEYVQTENDQKDVEIQTDNPSVPPQVTNRTVDAPSDIFFLNENDRREITAAMDEDFSDNDAPTAADGEVPKPDPKTDDFGDDLDFNFNTEDIMKEITRTSFAEQKRGNEVTETIRSAESVILVSTESNNNIVNKGVKRQMPESPVCDLEKYRSKRPCAKFIDDEMSVGFTSQDEEVETIEEEEKKKKKVVQFSEESDDYDQFLANALIKYENGADESAKLETTSKTRTQEQIEELENIIYNATRPKIAAKQDNSKCKSPQVMKHDDNLELKLTEPPQKNSCRVEDDMDYFDTSSGCKKATRRDLFDSKNDRVNSTPNKFSESLFGSDRNNTVVANCTLTKDNVDVLTKDGHIQSENDLNEEEDEIFAHKSPNVVILQNVVLKPSSSLHAENLSQTSNVSDQDVVECTPQATTLDISKHREESVLNVTLPPPLEFQDSERPNLDQNDDDVSLISPPRRPLAVVNKITSTPYSQKQASETLSISPISFRGTTKKPSKFSPDTSQENRKPTIKLSPVTKNAINKHDAPQENKRTLSVYEMAQQQFSKFSPLTIVRKPQPQNSPRLNSTPKQKTILNYVRTSQEEQSEASDDSGKVKPCIACSRVSRDQVMAIASLTNKKLATYSANFTSRVTHLIVSVNEKNFLQDHTIKFVSAVASGVWVLNFGWIRECMSKNALVPEEPYEVLDVSGAPGPHRARLTGATRPLLRGYKVHAAAPFASTTQREVENLVRLLGGRVVPSPEHLLDKNGYICVIIAEARATQDFELYETWLEALKVVTVDMEWLSRSVGQYQLLSLRPFTLCSEEGIENLGYPTELTGSMSFSASQQTFSSVPSST